MSATIAALTALVGLATALVGLIYALSRKVQQISVSVDGHLSKLMMELVELRATTTARHVVDTDRVDQLTVALEGSDTDVPLKPPTTGATTP